MLTGEICEMLLKSGHVPADVQARLDSDRPHVRRKGVAIVEEARAKIARNELRKAFERQGCR